VGLSLGGSLFFTSAFTTNLLYYVQTVGLDPLQMVLMGTILEGTILIFEVPTGILADMHGRKASLAIGYGLTAAAFVLQALVPSVWAVALAQAVWGVGYTFTSGAHEAWIADEVGLERAGEAFSRGGQVGQVASLVGIALAGIVGAVDLALPILICGLGFALMGILVVLLLPEHGFQPIRVADWSGWRAMGETLTRSVQLARRQRTVMWLLLSGIAMGLYSEGYDRLWMAHMLTGIGLPIQPSLPAAVWFAGIRIVSALLGIVTMEFARRRLLSGDDRGLSLLLGANAIGIAVGILMMALSRSFWLAAAAAICVDPLRGAASLLRTIWLNRQIDDSGVRATVFSAVGQADSLGQVIGGPAVGWLAKVVSVPLGMSVSALLLLPVVPIYACAASAAKSPTRLDDT